MNRINTLSKRCFFLCLSLALPISAQADGDEFGFSYTLGAPGNTSAVALKGDIGTGSVQPGGAYNYTFPIEVPPGPHGIAPQLAIVYTGEGNGWVGKNWSFGFGSVTRDTREGVPSNFASVSNTTDLLLNGSTLVYDSGTTVKRYRTQIESHQYITYDSGSNKWVVRNPDGTVSEYATVIPAYTFNNATGTGVAQLGTSREWRLSTVTDTTGNTINYTYSSGSAAYPLKIVWGAPSYKAVWFTAVPRSDTRTSFASGSWIKEDQRLSKIDVYFDTDVDGNGGSLVRSYTLNYMTGPTSGASRLTSIVEQGPNASLSRTTLFSYLQDSSNLSATVDENLMLQSLRSADNYMHSTYHFTFCDDGGHDCSGPFNNHFGVVGSMKQNNEIADIDNDGIPEIIQGRDGPYGLDLNTPSIVWKLNTNYSQFQQDTSGLNVPITFRDGDFQSDHTDYGARFTDINRDGTQDIIFSYKYKDVSGEGGYNNNPNNLGKGWIANSFSMPSIGTKKLRFSYYGQDGGLRIADVNGDGKPDLLLGYDSAGSAAGYGDSRNNTDCFDPNEHPRPPGGANVYIMDPNNNWPQTPSYNLPSGVFFIGPVPANYYRCPDVPPDLSFAYPNNIANNGSVDADLGTQIVDVNGDGLPDIVKATKYPYSASSNYYGNGNGVWINNGNGWYSDTAWTNSLQGLGVYLHNQYVLCQKDCQPPWVMLDFNDDGLPDLQKYTITSGFTHYRNTGSGWVLQSSGFPDVDLTHGQIFQDFNGDGRPDYFQLSRTVGHYPGGYPPGPSYQSDSTPQNAMLYSDGSHPDLLGSVTNWMGGKLNIEYGHSSEWRTQHNGKLPQTRYLVTAVESDASPTNGNLRARDPIDPNSVNGVGGVTRTEYIYKQGEFNFTQREFRGFGTVIANMNPGNSSAGTALTTETHYLQENDTKGLVDYSLIKNAAGTVFQYKKYTYQILSPITGVYDRRTTQEVEKEDSNGPILKQTDYVYDTSSTYYGITEALGNLLSKTESGSIFSAPSTGRKTVFEYAPNNNTSKWLVNYPKKQKIFSASNLTTPVQETTYFYDSYSDENTPPVKGLLTKTVQNVKNYNGTVEADAITEATYDSYGNKTSDKNANGKISNYFYQAGTYLTQITNPKSQDIYLYYHGVNATANPVCDSVVIPGALQSFMVENQPVSAKTCYSYDALGRLSRVYDPLDPNIPQVKYSYFLGTPGTQRVLVENRETTGSSTYIQTKHMLDGFGRILQTKTEAPSGQELVTTRQFDLNGRLWRSSMPVLKAASDVYITPASGETRWSSTQYDILGRAEIERNIDGTTRSFSYLDLSVTSTNERGYKKRLNYDSLGRLFKVEDYLNSTTIDGTTTYAYNALDNLRYATDADNNAATYFYDSLGRRRRMEHPDRGVWNYTYDAMGNLREQVDPSGVKLSFNYDELGRLVQKYAPAANGGLLATFYYDNDVPLLGNGDLGDLVAWHDWGPTVSGPFPAWYDTYSLSNMTASPSTSSILSCSAGTTGCSAYAPRVEHKLKPLNSQNPNDPNAPRRDLQLSMTFLDSAALSVFADLQDVNGNTLYRSADLASGSGQTVTRTVKMPRYAYTGSTKVVIMVYYGQLRLYDSAVSLVDDNAAVIGTLNAPESAGRAFSTSYGWGKTTSFLDKTGQTAFSYDLRGRLAYERKVVDGLGYVTDTSYTWDDLPSVVRYPNGENVSYSYDEARRLTDLGSDKDNTGFKLLGGVSYNSNNLLSHVNLGFDGTNKLYYTDYTYQSTDFRLDTLITKTSPTSVLQSLGYNYDAGGNVIQVTDGATMAGTTQGRARIPSATYDHLDRLTSVQIPDPNTNNDITAAYSFGKTGNFLSFEGKTYNYGGGCVAPYSTKPHQLCRVLLPNNTSQQFSYDLNGNMLAADYFALNGGVWEKSSNGPKFAYDAENRLKRAEIPTSSGYPDCEMLDYAPCDTVDVEYDAQGSRVKRSIRRGNVLYDTLYIGPHYEKRLGLNQEGSTSLYHAFGRLIAERSHSVTGEAGTSQVRYFFADHLGSSSLVWNNASQPVWVQTYRPYGADNWSPASYTEPDNDQYKFTGQEHDYSFLYNFKARSYLPGIGAFAQADTYEGELEQPLTLNPYAYTVGNPLKYTDPTGNTPEDTIYIYPPNDSSDSGAYCDSSGECHIYAVSSGMTVTAGDNQIVDLDPQIAKAAEKTDITDGMKEFFGAAKNFALNNGITIASMLSPGSRSLNFQSAANEFMRGNFIGAGLAIAFGPKAKILYNPGARGTASILSKISIALNRAKIWTAGRFPLIGGPKGGMLARKTTNGSITHYAVYDANGVIIKRVDLVGRAHAGVPTPHVLDYIHDINAKTGDVFPRAPAIPRPATPDEIP